MHAPYRVLLFLVLFPLRLPWRRRSVRHMTCRALIDRRRAVSWKQVCVFGGLQNQGRPSHRKQIGGGFVTPARTWPVLGACWWTQYCDIGIDFRRKRKQRVAVAGAQWVETMQTEPGGGAAWVGSAGPQAESYSSRGRGPWIYNDGSCRRILLESQTLLLIPHKQQQNSQHQTNHDSYLDPTPPPRRRGGRVPTRLGARGPPGS